MALQDTLYALGLQVGRGVFDDPDRLRGLLAQAEAPAAEIDLVVDAARRGAHRGLAQALDAGTDPVQAVDAAGDRLAQERGTDPAGARWAVAVLGFAIGRVGENDVRRQRGPGPLGSPFQAPTQLGQPVYPAYPPTPTPGYGAPPGYGPPQPSYTGHPQQGYPQQPGAWSPAPRKKSKLPLVLGAGGAVLAVVVAVVLAVVLLGGSDDDESADRSRDTASASASASASATASASADEVSSEAAAGFTGALLDFSEAFGQGGEDLQTATTSDSTPDAKAAARTMRAAVYDLDLATRDLELDAVSTELNAFLKESGSIIKAFDEIERTATSPLDVNGGVAGLAITDYTDSFQALADAIDASRSGG